MTDENNSKLYSALVSALAEIKNLSKEADNPFFKSKYVELASVLDHTRPIFARHGLAILQIPVSKESAYEVEFYDKIANEKNADNRAKPYQIKRIEKGQRVLLGIKTIIIHNSGTSLETEPVYTALADQTAQAVGSAISYLRRYGIMSVAGIAGDDDDGEAATRRKEPQVQQPKRVQGVDFFTLQNLGVTEKTSLDELITLRDSDKFSKILEAHQKSLLKRIETLSAQKNQSSGLSKVITVKELEECNVEGYGKPIEG